MDVASKSSGSNNDCDLFSSNFDNGNEGVVPQGHVVGSD